MALASSFSHHPERHKELDVPGQVDRIDADLLLSLHVRVDQVGKGAGVVGEWRHLRT